jgi:hypothetical protein
LRENNHLDLCIVISRLCDIRRIQARIVAAGEKAPFPLREETSVGVWFAIRQIGFRGQDRMGERDGSHGDHFPNRDLLFANLRSKVCRCCFPDLRVNRVFLQGIDGLLDQFAPDFLYAAHEEYFLHGG